MVEIMKKSILTFSILLGCLFTSARDQVLSQDTIFTSTDTIICDLVRCDVREGSFLYYHKHPNYNRLNKIYIRYIDHVTWNGSIFTQSQLIKAADDYNTARLNAEYNKITKLRKDNYKYRGYRQIKAGGVFALIGGLSLTTGMILSTQSGTSPQLIHAFLIGGAVNISIGSGFVISGVHVNQNKK